MSQKANFFTLPTDDQVTSLSQNPMTTNAANALSPQRVADVTSTHNNINNSHNHFGSQGTTSSNNNNNNEALQQVMGLLQQLMSQNNPSINSTSNPLSQNKQLQPLQPQQPQTQGNITINRDSATATGASLFSGDIKTDKKPMFAAVPPPGSTVTSYEYPSPMSDLIYIGGAGDARNKTRLKALNIQFIINLCPGSIPHFFPSDFIYKDFSISDNQLNLLSNYSMFQEFMDSCLNAGMKVLIHDETGVWKTPALVIAYLCYLYNWNLKEAYDFCRGRRREIKLPSQVLVSLGNWEISTIGASSLLQIVLSKKQKAAFSDGGELITDKTLQGFLSNRQARAAFDYYEEQITTLTVKHRDIYNRYLQLKLAHSQLELDLAMGKANRPVKYDMSLYVPETELEPFILFGNELGAVMNEYNKNFQKLTTSLIKRDKAKSSAHTKHTSAIPEEIDLPSEMNSFYTEVNGYINNFSNQVTNMTKNHTNLPVGVTNDIEKLAPPQYPTTATLTSNGYLTIDILNNPLKAQNDSKSAKNSPQQQAQVEQSITPSASYSLCLFCSTIQKDSAIGQCHCGQQRDDLVTGLHKVYINHLGQSGLTSNSSLKLIHLTFQSLYFLSLAYPSIFKPITILNLRDSDENENNKNNNNNGQESNDDIITQLPESLATLSKTIQGKLVPILPPQNGTSPKSRNNSQPSHLDPSLADSSHSITNDLISIINYITALVKAISEQSDINKGLVKTQRATKRLLYLVPMFTLATAFVEQNSIYKHQLLVLQKEWLGNASGDSQEIVALRNDLQCANDNNVELENTIKAKDDEIAKRIDEVLKKDSELGQNREDIIKKDAEIALLMSQAGGSSEVIATYVAQIAQHKQDNGNLQEEIEQLKNKAQSEEKAKIQLQEDYVVVKNELDQLKKDSEAAEMDLRKSNIAIQQAQALKLQQVSGDDDAIQAECIKQVIGILQTQKIWLGMQLGVTKDPLIATAYQTSLTKEQLQIELKGNIPETFIHVLEVVPEGVAARCGVRVGDIVVSFNGTLISSVKQIHSIATDITPGDRIAIAVLRNTSDVWAPMILSMETRSRLLNSKQLTLLRSIHRGDTKPDGETLKQVMEIKSFCDADSSAQNGGNGPKVTRRSSVPDLELMKSFSSLRDDPR